MQNKINELEAQHTLDQALIAYLESEGLAQRDKIAQLETALISARRIGGAIGILMGRHRITQEEAFERLKVASQQVHRKLRDLADDVLLTGELPSA